MAFDQHRARQRIQRARLRNRRACIGAVDCFRRWIRNDGAKQFRETLWLDKALAFDDLAAVRSEDHGGRPTVVAISIR